MSNQPGADELLELAPKKARKKSRWKGKQHQKNDNQVSGRTAINLMNQLYNYPGSKKL